MKLACLVACVLALWARAVTATIHTYYDESLPTDLLIYRHVGMYSVYDAPYVQKNGQSFIKVALKFKRKNPEYHNEPIKVQLSIFEASYYDYVGYTPPNSNDRLFCCSPELKEQGICDEEYTLIIKEDESKNVYVTDIEFEPPEYEYESSLEQEEKEDVKEIIQKVKKDKGKGGRRMLEDTEYEDDMGLVTGSVYLEKTFPINKKGMYYLMFSSCNELTGEVLISGETVWLNPFGFLPGELYGFLPFYSKLSMTYLVVALAWGAVCAYNWRQLLALQNFVTLVLGLGMIEMSLRYFDFATFNKYGTRGTGLMLTAATFQTVKKTVSRLLVLVVSMGYGVVRPTLGEAGNKVLTVGCVYFVFAAIQHIVENVSHTVTITFPQYLLMLPVAGAFVFSSLLSEMDSRVLN